MRNFVVHAGVFAFAICAQTARAWGPEGHALVADMAEMHLSAAARAQVVRLLALESHATLDDVSSWADDYRSSHPETGPGHYVDIPLSATSYSEDRDCHYDKDDKRVSATTCVVAMLSQFQQTLSDATQSDATRLAALKWVVHFVGDIHQPLHAENNVDKGGNSVSLAWFGATTNLHAMWDGGMIEHYYGWTLGANYSFDHAAVRAAAQSLDATITADQRKAWGLQYSRTCDEIVQWANDAHALAAEAYLAVPLVKQDGWQQPYQDAFFPVVLNQLERASVRLAALLNAALGQP